MSVSIRQVGTDSSVSSAEILSVIRQAPRASHKGKAPTTCLAPVAAPPPCHGQRGPRPAVDRKGARCRHERFPASIFERHDRHDRLLTSPLRDAGPERNCRWTHWRWLCGGRGSRRAPTSSVTATAGRDTCQFGISTGSQTSVPSPPSGRARSRTTTRWPRPLNGISKAELIETQHPWKDVDQVIRAIFQWITSHNGERLHSALDYVPPAEYEGAWWRSKEQTPQSAWTKTTGLYETRGSSGCAAGCQGGSRRAT